MRARRLGLCWALALTASLSAYAALAMRGAQFTRFPDAPVVAVGSSLTLYGVSERKHDPEGLLGDGRDHARSAVPRITESEALERASAALDGGAKTILLEVNPFAVDFKSQTDKVDRPDILARVSVELSRQATAAKLAVRAMIGLSLVRAWDVSAAAPAGGHAHEDLGAFYPVRLRAPRRGDDLRDLIGRARLDGVEIVLVAPPRSQLADDFMGAAASAALQRHLVAFAAGLGVPLFAPAAAWPDDHFLDRAHMSAIGRARFERALAAWWPERR